MEVVWERGVLKKVPNECHLSSIFSLNNQHPVAYPCLHSLLGQVSCTKSWRALRHCSASLHARTHSPIALNKSMPPLGWTGIISSRWFMMDMGNVFTETTWVTSFSRPENKYRPLYHTIAQASVVLASHHCVSHTSLTPLQGTAHPLCPRCPCEICVRLCNCNRVHLHGNVLAAVKCVYCWNGSCCWRPALSPRKAFSWPIHLYLRYFPTSTFGTWFLLWLQQL